MFDPDVRFDVESGVVLAIDLDGSQRAGHDVGARFGESHISPGFPFGNRPRDGHRSLARLDDSGARANVDPQPGIEGGTVPFPRDVTIDRGEGIAMLQSGTDWKDESSKPVVDCEAAETFDEPVTEPPALEFRRDRDLESVEGDWFPVAVPVADRRFKSPVPSSSGSSSDTPSQANGIEFPTPASASPSRSTVWYSGKSSNSRGQFLFAIGS